MDPVSAIGLAIQVGNIILLVMRYGREAKDAGDEIQALSAELFALEGILRHIEVQSSDLPSTSQFQSPAFMQLLFSTRQMLDSLGKTISPPSSSTTLSRAARSLKWPLKKSQVTEQIQKLERLKTLYILSLTGGNLSNHHNLLAELARLGDAVEAANQGREDEKRGEASLY
jgi:hypothetical protein